MNTTGTVLIRALLTLVGSFLIGNYFMGSVITPELWQIIVGIILSVASVIWSIRSKNLQIEAVQSTVRQIVVFIGGLLIAKGKLSPEKLEAILGVLAALIAILQSELSKRKTQELKTGGLHVSQLTSKKP